MFVRPHNGIFTNTVSSETVKWDIANEYGATTTQGESDAYFAKILREKSGGRIVIANHIGGALGYKSKDQFDAVGDGAIPIADAFVTPLGGIYPMFLLSYLPFMAATPQEAKILWEVAKPYYDEIFQKNNQILLYVAILPPSKVWAKKPIDSVKDFKSLNLELMTPMAPLLSKR